MSLAAVGAPREIVGPEGRLEVLVDDPEGTLQRGSGRSPRAVAVFAHPHPQHGGTMHNKVVYRGAKALCQIGFTVLRFNFRGVGRSTGSFDEGRGEMNDYRTALDFVADRYPGVALCDAGFSFGTWIALTVGAGDPRVRVLLGIAPPLNRDMTAVLASHKPTFLIHGERDS